LPPPPTVVCQDVGTLSMKYIWLGTRASPGPRYNPRGPTTIILESGQISLARAGGIRPGRCRGRGRGRPPDPAAAPQIPLGELGSGRPHIGPVPGATLGCLWGPGSLPNEVRRLPRDNPRRPKPPPWSASGDRASREGPGASRRQPRRPKRGLPPQRRAGFNKYQKRMNISLRRNVHAVEARSPYWSKEGAGRTRITTASRKLQTHAKTRVVENMHAAEVKSLL
jgi:hypothetical protein